MQTDTKSVFAAPEVTAQTPYVSAAVGFHVLIFSRESFTTLKSFSSQFIKTTTHL